MARLFADTTPEAERVLIELMRQAPPQVIQLRVALRLPDA
jgi:hypothetical protein